ncbi:hypothetical protein QBC47DRAFT_375757 [Echria macrotheca]|uniref:FAS1 domain-containing protein n=1 Tax=Echria macrotheca TaxID=438768 RepID=A0AAJ0BHM5_9PEZI|nr:hypothetical protein QBC47DRAFT_375757 [Echria macrotheca]
MRPLVVCTALLSGVVSSQLLVPLFRDPRYPTPFRHGDQILMDPAGPGPAIPPSAPSPDDQPGPSGDVMLSDVMGRDRSINLFAGFVRDIESASRRLDDASQNTTVLAPLNSAIEALPRKPWEDPRDYGALGPNAYEGGDGSERAHRNLRRFVEAHMVPLNPWPEGKNAKAIGDDQTIWWEMKDGVRVIQPAGIQVVSIASTVSNGQVWILKGVRNYA